MNALDEKINQHYTGFVVRKDLVKEVKGNAIVPSYVLEYLLGQYCATDDPATIQSGISQVKAILAKHYVHRNQSEKVRMHIKESGRAKVIDKIGVVLNDKKDAYHASFSNLGIKEVLVDSDTVKRNEKLLTGGVWCIVDLEYDFQEGQQDSPWVMTNLKAIQMPGFDFGEYAAARGEFTTEEWIDVLMQSIGFNPEMFGRRAKLHQLVRLIPFCERNYNLIELGPKGTGKSHIFSEFSPHATLISGADVTVPKLFVNNSTGKIGLVGYWDVVALDEFAGREKKPRKDLVDILKNYMANKSFNRGIEPLGAEASMAFVGNTRHNVPYMLKHSDLFCELPKAFHDSAFLDRMHFFIPGWEVGIIRGEMFTDGFGFVVDYLAEALRALRNHDFAGQYQEHFSLSDNISTRDRTAIHKTFSGLMKIIFPAGGASKEEVEELLKLAVEGRKRTKDQILRIDETFEPVEFGLTPVGGESVEVQTLEEKEYPALYHRKGGEGAAEESEDPSLPADQPAPAKVEVGPEPGEIIVTEGQRGYSYDKLFRKYINGARKLTITDAYILTVYQVRNLLEFLEMAAKTKPLSEEMKVHLLTAAHEVEEKHEKQLEFLDIVVGTAPDLGITFSYDIVPKSQIHARHIVTDHGWKINMDRGLDIFQQFDANNILAPSSRIPQLRACKPFEITYLKTS